SDGLVWAEDDQGVYRLQSFNARIDLNRTRPSDNTKLIGNVHIYGMNVEVHGQLDRDGKINQMDLNGQVTLAVGDTDPDGKGEWNDGTTRVQVAVTPGALLWTKNGFELGQTGLAQLTLSGEFNIFGFRVAAQDLNLQYRVRDRQAYLLVSG